MPEAKQAPPELRRLERVLEVVERWYAERVQKGPVAFHIPAKNQMHFAHDDLKERLAQLYKPGQPAPKPQAPAPAPKQAQQKQGQGGGQAQKPAPKPAQPQPQQPQAPAPAAKKE